MESCTWRSSYTGVCFLARNRFWIAPYCMARCHGRPRFQFLRRRRWINNTFASRLVKCSVCCLFGRSKLLMTWVSKIRPAALYFCLFFIYIYIFLRPSLDFCIVSVVLESPRVNTSPSSPRGWIAEPCTHVMQYPDSSHFSHFFYAKASVPLLVSRRRCLWQLPRFCWKWAVLCSAQTHLTSCVHTADVMQVFWLRDWKYIETTCVPKRVCQVLLYQGC